MAKHITVGGSSATAVGTPEQVSEQFEKWIKESCVDGFKVANALKAGTFVDLMELRFPDLRKRGPCWEDNATPANTYRETLRMVGACGAHTPADIRRQTSVSAGWRCLQKIRRSRMSLMHNRHQMSRMGLEVEDLCARQGRLPTLKQIAIWVLAKMSDTEQ